MTYRRPWYWLGVLAFVALGVTLVLIQGARSRIDGNNRQFEGAQQLRLQGVEQRVDEYFGASVSLVHMGGQTFAHIFDDRNLESWLVRQTFRGRRNQDVYGLGVVFAPYRFETKSKFVCFYERVWNGELGRFDTRYSRNVVDVRAYGDEKSAYDYTSSPWYRRALKYPGIVAYSGPYTSGSRSFISTVQAFYRNNPKNPIDVRVSTDPKVGPLAGVVTVDILTSRFLTMLHTGLLPSDVVWVQSGLTGRSLVGTGALPSDAATNNIDRAMPLHYTGAILHISSDAFLLRAENQTVVIGAIFVGFIVLGLCGLVALGLLQRWRQLEANAKLQAEQSRLAQEVAVAKSVESEMRKTAFTDSLTGFPNRAAFMEHVAAILGTPEHAGYSVLLVDLDRFNVVNETLGHTAGDELLRALARRLSSRLSENTFIGRLGGDEFVFVAREAGSGAERLACNIMDLLREPVVLFGQTLYMQASVGIVAIDESYQKPDELLRDADIAVYRAKNRGRARFETFDMAMRSEVARDSEFEAELRRGIERGEFVPYYQPIVHLETGEISSFEALARWVSPAKGVISAGDFVPFAESRGLAPAIDSAIMRAVCSQSSALLAIFPGVSVAVNVSAAELSARDLPENIGAMLRDFRLPALRLRLEITETAMMAHAEDVNETLERLQDMGVAMLLDDFGTGYSSLAYLQRLPIVGLKIDKSFVEHVHEDERAYEIVRSIVAIAEAFGLETTAEGVETEKQLQVIKELGISFAQGFFFSQALDISQLASLRAPGSVQTAHFEL